MKTEPFKLTRSNSESAKNIYEELSAHHTGTLGTIAKEGIPHLAAVYYTVDDNFVLRFVTKAGTQKHSNIKRNKHVQFLVFDEKTQLTIRIDGVAHEILDGELRTKAVNRMYWLANQNDFNSPPISKLYAGEYVAYRIVPKSISMAYFIRPQKGGYDMFEKLEFDND